MTRRPFPAQLLATLCLVGLCAFIGWSLVSQISLKGIDFWALAGMATLGLLSIGLAIALDKDRPRSTAGWLRPGGVARVVMAILFALGLVISVYQVVSPTPAVESEPGLLESQLGDIRSEQKHQTKILTDIQSAIAPDTAPARELVSGVWGDEACAVTFRFTLTGDVLTVEGLKQPAGTAPYKATASVIKADGLVLTTQDETPGDNKGRVSTLTLSPKDSAAKMIWKNGSDEIGETLIHCPG